VDLGLADPSENRYQCQKHSKNLGAIHARAGVSICGPVLAITFGASNQSELCATGQI
jgi:hypothetical protein